MAVHAVQLLVVTIKIKLTIVFSMHIILLRNMLKNQSGIIRAVKVDGELGRRIREMGLVPGTQITIYGRAPLKDPVAIRVMSGTLTLRNSEADHIEVEVQ